MLSSPSARSIVAAWSLVVVASSAIAQQPPASPTRPPLLFKEEWRLPPHEGAPTDENMKFTPAVVSNDRLEARLYGPNSSVIRAAEHEGRSICGPGWRRRQSRSR